MIYLILALCIVIIYIIYDNNNPVLTEYNLYIDENRNISLCKDNTKTYKKYTFYQISDLHNYNFGDKQKKILKLISEDAEYIFITGDIIDRRNKEFANVKILIEELNKRFLNKIIFVSGNHEKGSALYSNLLEYFKSKNIILLDDKKIQYKDLNIIGIEDPAEYISINKKVKKDEEKEIIDKLDNLISNDDINILLIHRPEFFEKYAKYNISLALTGHAHGGQVRIFDKPLIAPGQGFFPKYAGGLYENNNTIMINNRGLGNNFFFAKRVFNTPEIVKINLYTI